MSVRENLFINPFNIGKALLAPYLASEEVPAAFKQAKLFDTRPRDTEVPISALSGGNQQKAVMARWMNIETPVLILEDPTAGVDVGARSEIYALLNQGAGSRHRRAGHFKRFRGNRPHLQSRAGFQPRAGDWRTAQRTGDVRESAASRVRRNGRPEIRSVRKPSEQHKQEFGHITKEQYRSIQGGSGRHKPMYVQPRWKKT